MWLPCGFFAIESRDEGSPKGVSKLGLVRAIWQSRSISGCRSEFARAVPRSVLGRWLLVASSLIFCARPEVAPTLFRLTKESARFKAGAMG